MDEREANIDVVFRNGLKDYEVLPPPEAWNSISPLLKRKKPFIFLRVAAVAAVLMMIGFLAYWLGTDLPTGIDDAVTALNENPAPVIATPRITNPLYVIPKENNVSSEDVAKELPEIRSIPSNVPGPVHPGETENISIYNQNRADYTLAALKPEKAIINTPEPVLLFPEEKPVVNKGKRWSIAALASPTYNSKLNSVNDDFSRQLDASESQGNSYSGGVTVAFKVNRRFSVQSGVFYSSMGKEVGGISSFAGFERYVSAKGSHNFEVLTTNGSVLTNNSDVFLMSATGDRIITNYTRDFFDPEKASLDYINNSLNQNFSYLELPISLRYKLIDKTLDFNLIGGISYNLLVKNSVYAKVDGGRFPIGHTEGLNPVSISSSFGMGMEYNLSDRFSLNLEPTFRYYLNPINELARTNLRPYSFGVFSGLSYKF